MALQQVLQLGGRDVHAAADDDVLGPVHVAQVLALVAGDLEHVTAAQVALLVERVLLGGPGEVAGDAALRGEGVHRLGAGYPGDRLHGEPVHV
ncbi:hypothetical protein ACFQ1S_44980, partial [Kibdelosporangium lantanae]